MILKWAAVYLVLTKVSIHRPVLFLAVFNFNFNSSNYIYMKNIKIKFTVLIASLMALASCKKDFITIQPQGQFLSENYYANRDQAYAALVGVYDVLRKNAGGFENMVTFMNAGSDDHVAGGGGASD